MVFEKSTPSFSIGKEIYRNSLLCVGILFSVEVQDKKCQNLSITFDLKLNINSSSQQLNKMLKKYFFSYT